ncbi:hypothetical protein [Jeongeupia naejangsanensis]|uniref:Uncharacterized protein n=1 Tax=Jeongeupia naejangsanensis TaxID=613195 RepID=A0ABS2BLA7_9NEIS|nr:hypothetical protein [Jeongeupia naejangsanensis]MBM3116397.1 hypothetical protein [Jeongeupia naejangsanensis]
MEKIFLLKIFVFILLFILSLFYFFVVRKQEIKLRIRLSVLCGGFLICIAGLGFAAYLDEVDIGAKIILLGIIVLGAGIASVLAFKKQDELNNN